MMEVDQVNLNGIPGDSQPITGIIYPPQNVRSKLFFFKKKTKHNLILL